MAESWNIASSSVNLYLTEIDQPSNIITISASNSVTPKALSGLLGGLLGSSPQTLQYTSLDNGDIFVCRTTLASCLWSNPILQPRVFGLGIWESINGEPVTIRSPRAVSWPNNYGDTSNGGGSSLPGDIRRVSTAAWRIGTRKRGLLAT